MLILNPSNFNNNVSYERTLMKNCNLEYVTFPSEIASEQIRQWRDENPQLVNKNFVVLISERDKPLIYRVRRLNFTGLVNTARWCRDEESRTAEYWNCYDSVTAPSRADTDTSRSSHYCRGVTSWIPEGALVDLAIIVHDTKKTADQQKEFLSRFEAKLCRRPPETTPELEKVRAGKDYNEGTLIAELIKKKRCSVQFFEQNA